MDTYKIKGSTLWIIIDEDPSIGKRPLDDCKLDIAQEKSKSGKTGISW